MATDRIIIRKNANMQQVIDWSEKLKGVAIELPFDEAEIEFQEELILLHFKRDEMPGIVNFTMSVLNEQAGSYIAVCGWRANMETGEREVENYTPGERAQLLSMILAADGTINKCMAKFKALMLFTVYYREDIERTKTINRSATKRDKNSKRKGSQRKPLTIRRYTIDNEMFSELPAPKKQWHGYKESFGVRGHYRSTKTGKTIWVRPYQKKGISDKKKPNEFVL